MTAKYLSIQNKNCSGCEHIKECSEKVKKKLCLICKEPIAEESFIIDITFKRFGQFMFIHKRCQKRTSNDGRQKRET
ncbi:MAG: hypothetical protein JXB50_16895 [Spirochaetes bacterium]|nr:hypothetical protein [Spirochaetota bacterium]